jgi:transposase-like protein
MKRRRFSKEVKIAAVRRVLAGEKRPPIIAEMGIGHGMMSNWMRQYKNVANGATKPEPKAAVKKIEKRKPHHAKLRADHTSHDAVIYLNQAVTHFTEGRNKVGFALLVMGVYALTGAG